MRYLFAYLYSVAKGEPVLITAFVQAVLGLLIAFAVPLSTGQVAAILAVSGAFLALVARRRVSPVS